MAAGNSRPWQLGACVVIICMLGCQTWTCAAYNNQQSKWLTKNLTPGGSKGLWTTFSTSRGRRAAEHSARRLHEESKAPVAGWRVSLVNEDHRLHTLQNLSGMERIAHGVQKSRARASGLDARARAAPYHGQQHMQDRPVGRKMLQSDDTVYRRTQGKFGLRRKALQSATPGASYESDVEATPGSYSMAFSLGTPPQNFVAIADTGSDLVWIQCAACTVCFAQSTPAFDPTASTTYANMGCSVGCNNLGNNQLQCSPNCQYNYTYGDQSATIGDFATETVNLTGYAAVAGTPASALLVPKFQFGCGLQNQGTFTNTDGLVGLARGPISFPSQIAPYVNNTIKFSYCLVSKIADSAFTSPIIFGPAAVPANATGVSYTPMLTPYNTSVLPFYYVNLVGITLGGTAVSIPTTAFQIDANGNGGTIFDSGTTYTQLNPDAYTPVVNEFITQLAAYQQVNLKADVGLDLCYDITNEQAVSVPDLVFNFENADFDLKFDNIFVRFDSADGLSSYMCLALMQSDLMNIFGSTQQQDFQVVYEEDSMQIGWIPQDCKTL